MNSEKRDTQMTKSATIANEFATACASYGWSFEVKRVFGYNHVVRIEKTITPNCNDDFCKADSEYHILLGILPQGVGSIWGYSGDGIGAMVAMESGRMIMNASGIRKSVLKELMKL
jgi:hypothetical protein